LAADKTILVLARINFSWGEGRF